MWVVFEGLDKAGKGTLEWEFLKATNFKHIVIDRGPVGYFVFDKLFKRTTDEGAWRYAKNIETMRVSEDFVVVYCKAPINIVMQRLEEHNEICPYDYEQAQILYDKGIKTFYENLGIKVIMIDTAKSIEGCVQTIIKELEGV